MPYSAERRRLVESAFAGQAERPLISLWQHWPEQDQEPGALGAAHVDFQRRFDFDFVKFTPSGTDAIEDWGARTTFSGDPHGTRDVIGRGIGSIDDWGKVRPRERRGSKQYAQLGAIRHLRQELGPHVPILQTISSPLTIARRLAGDRLADDLRTDPSAVGSAIAAIVDDTLRFLDAAFAMGADGLFFVTQAASTDVLAEEEHAQLGVPADTQVLAAARERTPLTVLHAHGSNLLFDQLLTYPVAGLSWHDRAVGPSIAEMRRRFAGLLVGGIDEWRTLVEGPPRRIKAEIEDAIRQADGAPLCVAAGCVIGYRTPERYTRAAREAITT